MKELIGMVSAVRCLLYAIAKQTMDFDGDIAAIEEFLNKWEVEARMARVNPLPPVTSYCVFEQDGKKTMLKLTPQIRHLLIPEMVENGWHFVGAYKAPKDAE